MPFSRYMSDRLGHAEISPQGPHVAGAHVPLTITYTAGPFGIDDTGALKFSWRTASDSGKPQFTDPRAPNYTTAIATNGATLEVAFNRNNIRPWVNTVFIRVAGGFLREGDQIVLRLGDPAEGSPGYRLQTCCDDDFQFKAFVDAFATYDFVPLPESPTLRLVPGSAVRWKAYLPTLRRPGDRFRLAIVPEDRWGNPTSEAGREVRLTPTVPVQGLPEAVTMPAEGPCVIDGLSIASEGAVEIALAEVNGARLGASNPLRIVTDVPALHYWGDLHGQSNETVGTNTVQQYFAFARDRAFLDLTAHQGNDFQVEADLWSTINKLSCEYDEPGKFVALPAYEWSGNTGMGGDHNVYYRSEGRPIYRSSKVLLDEDDGVPVCPSIRDLYAALQDEDAVVLAHVGGRYADISVAHDGRLEPSVEIHSCWGTFEWLLHDAFDLGYRVGIICHSDDHKGRPGAAYPGASTFGAIGGLTCYLMPALDRDSTFRALRARRHYGTTGTRLYLDVRADFAGGAKRFLSDPKLGPAKSEPVRSATMGDIVRAADGSSVELAVDVHGSAPIERVTIFNGKTPVAVHRPFAQGDLGRRIRVIWEGAEYRGRGREVYWRGHCRLAGNRFDDCRSFNLFNVDKPLSVAADGSRVDFDSVTTGNFAGFDLWLADAAAGELAVSSNVLDARLAVSDIALEERIFEGGGLGKRLRVFRLPDANGARAMSFRQRIEIEQSRDNPVYVRVTQEDGHQAWSSPIYFIP